MGNEYQFANSPYYSQFSDSEIEDLAAQFTGEKFDIVFVLIYLIVFLFVFGMIYLFLYFSLIFFELPPFLRNGISGIIACISSVILINLSQKKRFVKKVIKNGKETMGKIEKIDAFGVEYTYSDGLGNIYTASHALWKGNQNFTVSEGESYPVFYLPDKPKISFLDYENIISNFLTLKGFDGSNNYYSMNSSQGDTDTKRTSFSVDEFKKVYYDKFPFVPLLKKRISNSLYYIVALVIASVSFIFLVYSIIFEPSMKLFSFFSLLLLLFSLLKLFHLPAAQYFHYLSLKGLYTKGLCTKGKLESYGTPAFISREIHRRARLLKGFPLKRVTFTFYLPQGTEYKGELLLSIPTEKRYGDDEIEQGITVGKKYPVYYDPLNPAKNTIDLFGLTPDDFFSE